VISKTVNVTSICNLNASFSHTLGANGQVLFSSTATGTIGSSGYAWNFGDNTNGTGKNTSHTYANGTYMVTHVVTNYSVIPTCTAVAYDTITVTNNTCIANAGFSVIPTATAQYWNAYPLFPTNVVAAEWSWGDNSYSPTLYTSHTYSAPGLYTLCLSVTVSCGASDVACASYSIFRSSSDNQMVHVNVIDMTTVGLDKAAHTEFAVYPNPADKELLINSNLENTSGVKATIFNLTGARVLEQPFKDYQKQLRIDTQALPAGVYILNVTGEGLKPVTQRIVIDR
jgi:PKD repeat protein